MFLYLVDVKKSQMECDKFVKAEADLKAFKGEVHPLTACKYRTSGFPSATNLYEIES
jgi:hypothetical protein